MKNKFFILSLLIISNVIYVTPPVNSLEMSNYPLWYKKALNIVNINNNYDRAKIAVIDTGVDYNHPALQHAVTDGYNAITDQEFKKENSIDSIGHGTHVAGIIAGVDHNLKIYGILDNVEIIPIIALDEDGGSDKVLIKAIEWAITKRPDVINLSLGREANPFYNDTEGICDSIKKAYENDIFVVVAAGNSGGINNPLNYPAGCKNSISVVSINKELKSSSFSNYDSNAFFSAPGEEILSTLPISINPSGYGYLSGTSMAAPQISAIIGLYKSMNKEKKYKTVIDDIIKSTIKLGSSARDPYFGYGIIDFSSLFKDTKKITKYSIINNIKNSKNLEIKKITRENNNNFILELIFPIEGKVEFLSDKGYLSYKKIGDNKYEIYNNIEPTFIYLEYQYKNNTYRSIPYYDIPYKEIISNPDKSVIKYLKADLENSTLTVTWDFESNTDINSNEYINIFIESSKSTIVLFKTLPIQNRILVLFDQKFNDLLFEEVYIKVYNSISNKTITIEPMYKISINTITAGKNYNVIKGDSNELCRKTKKGCKGASIYLYKDGKLYLESKILPNNDYYFLVTNGSYNYRVVIDNYESIEVVPNA